MITELDQTDLKAIEDACSRCAFIEAANIADAARLRQTIPNVFTLIAFLAQGEGERRVAIHKLKISESYADDGDKHDGVLA
jgi:hypothetical protein